MDAFQWNSCFVTGLTDVDEQHHRLVDAINQFGEMVMRPESASIAELESVFVKLADYTQYHFTQEESMMTAIGLDARHIKGHRQSHANFIDEVTQLHGGISANTKEAAKSLLQFLTHWLAYHILGSDQIMAKQIASVRSGIRPEVAYLTDATTIDPATESLLSALNGLFEQVSHRNRELVQLNKTLEARVVERTAALTDANQQLDDIANTDTLTGLPNRRYAMRSFSLAWDAAVRDETPIACMMIDADGFKLVNDIYGHDAGDTVLCALSTQLLHTMRTDDIVCRLGGDEFLVICAGTPLDGAMKLAESIRAKVGALRVPVGQGEWCGSVSVGVAARTQTTRGVEDLMKMADLGVYVAKRNGRNCVAISDQ